MEYGLTDLYPIFETLCRKYTGNESTSIPYEKAIQLMEAVQYCIEECFSSHLPTPSLSAAEAYRLGYQTVLRKTKQTADAYNHFMEHFSSYGNQSLEETLCIGFPAFFYRYDPLFAPQEHLLTLDYPILLSLEQLCGIDRIAVYLDCIEIEQKFLHCFSEGFIQVALSQEHPQWRKLFLNLVYPVLKKTLCLLLLDIHEERESFCKAEILSLQEHFQTLSKDAIADRLSGLLAEFLAEYAPQEKDRLVAYLRPSLQDIAAELSLLQKEGIECTNTIWN